MPTKARDTERYRERDPGRKERPRPTSRHRDYKHEKYSDESWDEEQSFQSSHSSSRNGNPARKGKQRRRRVVLGDRSSSSFSTKNRRRLSMSGHETSPRPTSASYMDSKTSLPYPSFSKAHSKEAVGSRDNLPGKLNVITPEPTDITAENGTDNKKMEDELNSSSREDSESKRQSSRHTRPPSPPLTNDDPQSAKKSNTSSGNNNSNSKPVEERRSSIKSNDEKRKTKTRPSSVRSSSNAHRKSTEESNGTTGKPIRPATPVKQKVLDALQFSNRPMTQHVAVRSKRSQRLGSSPTRRERSPSPTDSTVTVTEANGGDSDATSIAPNQPKSYQQPSGSRSQGKSTGGDVRASVSRSDSSRKSISSHSPRKPTTPPVDTSAASPSPSEIPMSIPKVDYLLQNGGLRRHIPKNLLSAQDSGTLSQQSAEPQKSALKMFEPYTKLLDDYGRVLTKGGSVAVATGYRSVARRLLDRLEAVFARDISSESCQCLMCYPSEVEEPSGVSWGDMLELVSGRRDLPSWPPFSISSQPEHAEVSGEKKRAPMQKMDIDVPEEHRELYMRHSRKTKESIDKWLSRQTDDADTLPSDVDDETLMFAMLTHLDHDERKIFSALLDIPMTPPVPRREAPKQRDRPELLVQSGIALQRLYRLPSIPRDPESALYLLKNPGMHNVLATLAAVSSDEWDILVSGRFDGFLWSGAEDELPASVAAGTPRTGSRMSNYRNSSNLQSTKGSFRVSSQPCGSSLSSRSSTPASFGAPISIDEEQEIAALAEVERDIYLGMEALEDAFEVLHCKAEAVRRALRERGAGLTVASQARRGSVGGTEFLPGSTPGSRSSWNNGIPDSDTLTDDGFDDTVSLAPSDSASNISSNRKRRPKRRTERRTPAPVEEEEEDEKNDRHRNGNGYHHYHGSGSGRSKRR